MKARDIWELVNQIAPFSLALDWDNSGFQTGDPEKSVRAVALALDPSPASIIRASAAKADLLVAHHPLIFKPLSNLVRGEAAAAGPLLAIERDLAVLSAHTNWDAAGVPRALAELLEIKSEGFLEEAPDPYFKITLFIPPTHAAQVRDALFQAGLGRIGEYDSCSFSAPGVGTFRPSAQARPFSGAPGQLASVAEERLEILAPASKLGEARAIIRRLHPYEEPAADIYPLERAGRFGFGLVGSFSSPREPLAWIARQLGVPALAVAGPIPPLVSRVALLPGGGASYLPRAKAVGAEILVTGDLTHHQALLAADLGVGIVAAGHFATESPGVDLLLRELRALTQGAGLELIRLPEEAPIRHFAIPPP
ncbi:MAG: Nif3-like dinuclear metal center hexameric protein [Deltaproteobacteria bacterium]|jgi:dinuclear metal center YbgI/SA1388 family protein|nr:Nif3-like dinuclear metal center hexameric protein [Deltaproteobacteria bacterium]